MTKQEKARWVAEMHLAYAEGKMLQRYGGVFGWEDTTLFPTVNEDPNCWRIKPEPREFIGQVISLKGYNRPEIILPTTWLPGTCVRVTEVLEDE